ncbi:MAG: sensor histidine kinase [Lachnospiraceae bacterium]
MAEQTFIRFFNRIKVQKQLYIIFFLAIFIPVVAIGSYLIFSSRSMMLTHYEEQCHSDSLRIKSILLDLTSNVQTKANTLCDNSNLRHLLSTKYSSEKQSRWSVEQFKDFDTLLSEDVSIHSITVYTYNETLEKSKYIYPITDEIREKEWFQQASNSVTPFWTVEQEADMFGNSQLLLCLHTRIFLPEIQNYAILNVTVSNNNLKNRIENSSLITVIWLNEDTIFYRSSPTKVDDSITTYASMDDYRDYIGKVSLENTNMISCISSIRTPLSDDVFFIASLNDTGYPYINKMTIAQFSILFLILLTTSIVIYYYTTYFSRRVIALREAMHSVSHGNYTIVDYFSGTDEISEAFNDLNVMIQDILAKEASVYEAQIRAQELTNQQQQMEFKMLSSQINPHFLFNTLETIRMRSIRAGNMEVANAIKLLGKSMRYVLDNTITSFTTLARELDYIQTYLAIQRLRFHDRVNYSLRTPPNINLNEYQIMPLLLQPIVENAILHGLEEIEQNGRIIIHIHCKEGAFHIEIFDNGCGMSKDEMKEMEETIYHHPKDSSRSIGLFNIYHRIQLCYGEPYGLKVQSKKGLGTVFTVIIPMQTYKGGNTL